MATGGFLQNLISSLIDRRSRFDAVVDDRSLEKLCNELLSRHGDSSARRIGAAILNGYARLENRDKLKFFEFMNEKLDLDAAVVEKMAGIYKSNPAPENLKQLLSAAEPRRQELLRRLNQLPDATAALVSMREDLLFFVTDHPNLMRTDQDFAHLFSSWFNRGFLVVQPISWETPASILAKIIQYEAVHAIDDWEDLRRRLQPDDRRCFAFFHPAMPAEPLVFVEVALSTGTPTSIQAILVEDRATADPENADSAVFYSISNCQKGLRGISFGNSLIKQVASDLSREFPNIQTFVTLSPIPGFSNWLGDHEIQTALATEDNNDTNSLAEYSTQLESLAAQYLRDEKRTDGYPLDPVARFHLNNGAMLHDLHATADTSQKGMQESLGVMVNYLYNLDQVEQNHENYVTAKTIKSSKTIDQKAALKPRVQSDFTKV